MKCLMYVWMSIELIWKQKFTSNPPLFIHTSCLIHFHLILPLSLVAHNFFSTLFLSLLLFCLLLLYCVFVTVCLCLSSFLWLYLQWGQPGPCLSGLSGEKLRKSSQRISKGWPRSQQSCDLWGRNWDRAANRQSHVKWRGGDGVAKTTPFQGNCSHAYHWPGLPAFRAGTQVWTRPNTRPCWLESTVACISMHCTKGYIQ